MVILAPDPPPRQVRAANQLAQEGPELLSQFRLSAPALPSLFDDELAETTVTAGARVHTGTTVKIPLSVGPQPTTKDTLNP